MNAQALVEPVVESKALGPTLAARAISKRFGALVAVDHADLEIGFGIHALLGENGAGKSTLVKILYGYLQPDGGDVVVDGRAVRVADPGAARTLGIGLVFQQFTLIPALTVAENVALFLPDLGAVLDPDAIAARIRETGARYGLSVDPSRRVGTLSLPEQQRVEILRVLLSGARFLILDEPTSALPAQEIDALFEILCRLRDDGYPIVLITHKLPEVFTIADTVTVMRRGAVVATKPIGEVTEETLVQLMFGEAVPSMRTDHAVASPGSRTTAVELRALTSCGPGRPLVDLDLPPLDSRAGTLSGGNAQRFAVARELARAPRLLVLLYPTHGLDVPTSRAVQERLVQAREGGCAILLVSQDLQELTALSDRLLVMRDGALVAEVDPKTTDAYEIGALMTA
jgi:simple sugar transport system ATP-binding protein